MKRCAFLTTQNLHGFTTDDDRAIPHLARLGWAVDSVVWHTQDVDWDVYDLVIVRSTWDYQDHAAAFDDTLERIDNSAARLCNPLALMRWNMRKTYLRDLERKGVATLPTQWGSSPDAADLRTLHSQLDTDEIVIKPVVGANAQDAFRIRADAAPSELDRIAAIYHDREFLAQPFLQRIVTEGEFSLIYFNGELSHTIRKQPKQDDFRVQEEHGGEISPAMPAPRLLERAAEAMASLAEAPLYARADFVGFGNEDFAIMEFELIEPALYLRMDDDAPARFAAAIDSVLTMAGT